MVHFDFVLFRAVVAWRSSGLGEFFSLTEAGGMFPQLGCFSPVLGEERFIRAVAEILVNFFVA